MMSPHRHAEQGLKLYLLGMHTPDIIKIILNTFVSIGLAESIMAASESVPAVPFGSQ